MRQISSTLFILVIAATCCFCQQDRLIDRIKQNYNGSKTLSASVETKIVWNVREKTDNMRCSILLAPGDKFRIDLGTILLVSDGVTLWRYDKNLSQVIISEMSNTSIVPSREVAEYCERYPLTASKNKEGYDVLEWKADSSSEPECGGTTYVRIIADGKSATVREFFLINLNGTETTYTFTKTSWNCKIPKGSFAFAAPKGARVIDKR